MTDYGWQRKAACRGQPLELFYGPEGEYPADRYDREREAKAFCLSPCPVRQICLEDALTRGASGGVWGGLNGDERGAERRRRQRRAS